MKQPTSDRNTTMIGKPFDAGEPRAQAHVAPPALSFCRSSR